MAVKWRSWGGGRAHVGGGDVERAREQPVGLAVVDALKVVKQRSKAGQKSGQTVVKSVVLIKSC
jgi:hypothetical protein